MKRIGGYIYEKSTKKDKKLMVKVGGKVIHFGDSRYQQYHDRTKIWASLDHNDKTRQANYLKRTANIRDGKGRLTKDLPSSPNYHARRILWS